MPRRAEIRNNVDLDLYSVEIYKDTDFFKNFNPNQEFEKWAAIHVNNFDFIPDNMETFEVPQGLYVVFRYRGKASEALGAYHYIYGSWIPNSDYELDNRPHFARMGEKYKHENPNSEEDLWIPLRKK